MIDKPPPRLLVHRPGLQQRRVAEDAGERRAYLVGDDADQLGAQALRLAQLPVLLLELLLAPFEGRGHLVERRREVGLLPGLSPEGAREIAAGNALRSLRHAPHRVGDGTGELDAEQQDEEHEMPSAAMPTRIARFAWSVADVTRVDASAFSVVSICVT